MSRTDPVAAALSRVEQYEDAIDLHLDDALYVEPKREPMLIRDGKRGSHREIEQCR